MDVVNEQFSAKPYLLNSKDFGWESSRYNSLKLIQDFYDVNEHQLYYGYMQTDMIHFESIKNIQRQVQYWIDNSMWTVFDKLPSEGKDIKDIEKKIVAKQVWLFNQYQIGGKNWKYPMSVHYNPRQGIFVAHPGGTRSRILSLIGAEKTLVWFHSIDKERKPIGELEPVSLYDIRKMHGYENEINIDFVPDHGSFIPHISYDEDLEDNLMKVQIEIRNNILSSRIFCESDKLQILSRFVTPSTKKEFKKYDFRYYKLDVKNYSLKSELNCFFSFCIRRQYKDNNMSLILCK